MHYAVSWYDLDLTFNVCQSDHRAWAALVQLDESNRALRLVVYEDMR